MLAGHSHQLLISSLFLNDYQRIVQLCFFFLSHSFANKKKSMSQFKFASMTNFSFDRNKKIFISNVFNKKVSIQFLKERTWMKMNERLLRPSIEKEIAHPLCWCHQSPVDDNINFLWRYSNPRTHLRSNQANHDIIKSNKWNASFTANLSLGT